MTDSRKLKYILGTPQQMGVWTFLTNSAITNPWHNQTGFGVEVGIDFGMDQDTPVYALADGIVVGAQRVACPGGVVAVESVISIDGHSAPRKAVWYVQHLDVIDRLIDVGLPVQRGQRIGWSGGQLSGGNWPAEPACSGGPHIEVGINPPYGAPWNPHGYGPNVDPADWLIATIRGDAPTGVVETITTVPGFLPIAQQLTDAQRFRPLQASTLQSPFAPINSLAVNVGPLAARGIFVVLGFVLVVGVLQALIRPVAEEAAGLGAQVMSDAAELGAVA